MGPQHTPLRRQKIFKPNHKFVVATYLTYSKQKWRWEKLDADLISTSLRRDEKLSKSLRAKEHETR